MVFVRAVVVQLVTTSGRRTIARESSRAGAQTNVAEGAAGGLLALYQTRLIVGAACLEGAAFFVLIVYMLERSPWALCAAVAMILGVAAHFPTRQRVQEFIDRQTALLEEERQLQAVR
jgi:hypothetical protein